MTGNEYLKSRLRTIVLCLAFLLSATASLLATCSSASAMTLLVWGDSLSSAYNIPVTQGWVSLLQDRVRKRNIKVINGSIPGETSLGGAQRIDRAISDHNPGILLLALGSNDGLQGQAPAQLEKNLAHIIEAAQSRGARVLLLGMKVPPNYGTAYSQRFEAVYTNLADRHDLDFVPFFLAPIAQDFDYFQPDGLHPTAAAQSLLLEHIWPTLRVLLERTDSG